MDPNAWQAYQAAAAYSNRFSSAQQDDGNPYNNPAFLLAQHQLREAASHAYQNQILPPSLVQAAANNKNQLHQQALANLNMRESVMSSNALLTPPVTPVASAWTKQSSDSSSRSREEPPQQRRSVIEAKTTLPSFPGQPPPLTDSRVSRTLESPSPSFPAQPPPRQSSQPRSSSQAGFPGISSSSSSSNHYNQQHSPQYGNNYSPQAPSPQGYHSVHSPQEYHSSQRRDQERKVQNPDRHQRDERDRQRRELERARIEQEKQIRDRARQEEKLKEEQERQERQRLAEERREQERVRQEQEIRREQERIRQEQERQERLRKEQERMRQEQEERKRREMIERQKQEQERIRRDQEKLRIEHERKKREDEVRRREELERQQRKEHERQEKIREQERIRQEQEKIKREQDMIRQEQERILQEQERMEQQKIQEEQRDLGLARLSAMGALNDLGEEESNNYQYDQSIVEHPNAAFQSGINFHEINMFNQNRQNMIKQENPEQKPFINNHYNAWINRANELLDLSSSDSRETSVNNDGEQSGFIPQILMNPWDPQQAPMMTLAPIANAMQQYQQQWLTQYQQAAGMLQQDEESYPLGKFRVLCISPDEEMGFLINLPAPCNLLFQTEGLVSKNVDSPFLTAFQKFVKDPEGAIRKSENLTEAPDKPPPILPGKKAYVPPYTPKATTGSDTKDDKVKVSSSGLSRSLVIEPVKKTGQQTRNQTSPAKATVNRSSSQNSQNKEANGGTKNNSIISARPIQKKTKSKNLSDEEDATSKLQELPKREFSKRKAKEQASSKRKAQDKLLMDEDDPTLNNPALDLEDSDDDAEWTPVKDTEGKLGRSRKRGAGDSSDEDDFSAFNNSNKLKFKKRAYPEPEKIMNKRLSADSNSESTNNTSVPEGEDFKVGSFLILKTETSNLKPSLWRVDGKTLIQKYECLDEEGIKYKNVNTYSGWTASTRHRYKAVSVKVIKSTGQDTIVERLKDAEEPKPPPQIHSDSPKSEDPKSPPKNPVNIEEIQLKSRGETGQFQENFEVYMQTLISQCLDANFLNEIFSEADEYFVSNIEKVDSVTLLRKDKLLTGVTWTLRFQHALTVWPCLNDLGSEACTSTVCGACEKARAHSMLQMFGQPYNSNTLATIPPNPDAMMNRNFSVCQECLRLCHLYHRLHHQKQKLYMMCSEIVERRKTDSPGIDTTQILNQLLADDTWLETQFKKMQDLWADADCFIK